MNKNIIEKLYKKHNKFLLTFLQSRGVNKEDAEDIVQDVWLKVRQWTNEFYITIVYMEAYLIKMAVNAAGDLFRHYKLKSFTVEDEVQIKKSIETSKERIEEGTTYEDTLFNIASFNEWQNNNNPEDLDNYLYEIFCIAAITPTSFEVSMLDVIECKLNDMTEKQIADKYNTTRLVVHREFSKWKRFIKKELLK